jgi:hypothetical protein
LISFRPLLEQFLCILKYLQALNSNPLDALTKLSYVALIIFNKIICRGFCQKPSKIFSYDNEEVCVSNNEIDWHEEDVESNEKIQGEKKELNPNVSGCNQQETRLKHIHRFFLRVTSLMSQILLNRLTTLMERLHLRLCLSLVSFCLHCILVSSWLHCISF